jgi:hypothetical protein
MSKLMIFLLGVGIAVVGKYALQWLWWGRRRKLVDELREFFCNDLDGLFVVSRTFEAVDLPNLHLAITQYTEERGVPTRIIGYTGGGYGGSLRGVASSGARICALWYRIVDTDVDSQMQCAENGIYLIDAPTEKIAAQVRFTWAGHSNWKS